MIFKAYLAFLLAGSLFALSACHNDETSGDGFVLRLPPASIEIMMHSAGDYGGEPVDPLSNAFHAFFEAPGTPTVALTETTDLSTLGDYHLLYITEENINALDPADMATIRDWVTAGGILVIGATENLDTPSAFGDFLGASYAFTSTESLDGDTIVVTSAGHRLLTTPNVLDAAALSDWGSTTHGSFSSVGSAYTCVADDTDGVDSLPTLCAAPFSDGAIIITGMDPECDCHDDHLSAGTKSGSELLENYLGIVFIL